MTLRAMKTRLAESIATGSRGLDRASTGDHRLSEHATPADAYAALDFSAPIIIVGAGRSGSTLLEGVLGAHPDVCAITESSFLLNRMWDAVQKHKSFFAATPARLAKTTRADWAQKSWLRFTLDDIKFGDWESLGDPYLQAAKAEEVRMRRELGASFARLMIPPALVRPRWLMREIWGGQFADSYTYDLLAEAYPNALCLHSIRHPIDFVTSHFNRSDRVPDADSISEVLQSWLRMLQTARCLRSGCAYKEFKYEDFVGNASGLIEKVFSFVGLEVHEACREALDFRFVPSTGDSLLAGRETQLIDATPGMRKAMEELGYADVGFGRLRPGARGHPDSPIEQKRSRASG